MVGDNGKYYVPKELVPLFINAVIPKAYLITPNQFEAELLAEQSLKTESDAIAILHKLHALGPKVVVITSAVIEGSDNELWTYCLDASNDDDNDDDDVSNTLRTRADDSHESSSKRLKLSNEGQPTQSPKTPKAPKTPKITAFAYHKIPGTFTGTGDCLAALILAWIEKEGRGRAGDAVRRALESMYAIIKLTLDIQYQHKLKSIHARSPELVQIVSSSSPSSSSSHPPSGIIDADDSHATTATSTSSSASSASTASTVKLRSTYEARGAISADNIDTYLLPHEKNR